jgi:hypothetical protein
VEREFPAFQLSKGRESTALDRIDRSQISYRPLTFNLNRPPTFFQSPISSSLDNEAWSFCASSTSLKHSVHVTTMLRSVLVSSSI